MNIRRFMSKKVIAIGVAAGIALGGGGAAFAYFLGSGSGSGSGQTGSASALTISQVGPGYDSLASAYHQDQCNQECSGPTQFGNEINLKAGSGQLSNVVVAFRSYAGGTSTEPITLTLYSPNGSGGVTGQYGAYSSVTATPVIPAGNGVNGRQTFDATFNFSSQDLTISGPVVYGISYTDEAGVTINVALSNSVSNLTVGSDVYPGHVFVQSPTANVLSANGDAGSCATSTATVFMATNINCATPSVNYGAYGPGSNPNNADIPAVEFNVVGGTTGPLSPGGPAQPVDFAITNSGSSNAYVTTVSATIGTPSYANCLATWYALSPANGTDAGRVTLNQDIAPGTTFIVPSGLLMSMPAFNGDQSACEGSPVHLTFTTP